MQYFVTASDTGNKIPVEIDKSTSADLAATKESWQTDWTSEFIGDPALEKYTAKTEGGEIIALGAYRETEASMFVYIEYIESHPESNPTLTAKRKYLDIGRMMVAFGIQLPLIPVKTVLSPLKLKRMNLQNIISGTLAQFRSLPNNPVGRSC